MPNIEQIKSLVRWFLTWLGGLVTGYVTAKNWLTADQIGQVAAFFSNETVVTLIVSAAAGVWGVLVHTKKNMVAVVDEMPEVAGVVTKPTEEGLELAQAVPSPTVAPAGTAKAAEVARAF